MTAPAGEEAVQQPGAPAGPTVRPVEWATVPRVNLLPREILEGRTFRRIQVLLGLVVLLTLGAAATATVWASNDVTDAQTELDAADMRVTTLQARQAQYAEVPRVTAQLDALTAARAEAMATDVSWYRYMTELRGALPNRVTFGTLNVAMTVQPGTTPLSTAGIGSLTISGTARTTKPPSQTNGAFDGVADWMDSLEKVTGIDGVALTTATSQPPQTPDSPEPPSVTFESTGVITEKALSHLFDERTGS